ncbi:MAG: hypothetical protein MUQ30_15830 [Anaerolineae bacterium]|nr:hypothetical protein [Anaerolineae bacterium]
MVKFVVDAEPEAEWQVWYEDTFDRECPRQVQAAGTGLAAGLVELWRYHLRETVQADGRRGFSRFNLWWKQAGKSVTIIGDWEGMVRLRGWIFGPQRRAAMGHVGAAGPDLLMTVAATHSSLVAAGKTSAEIVSAALVADNREDFENRLARLL